MFAGICNVALFVAALMASPPHRVPQFGRLFSRRPREDCRDAHDSCADWAADGECEANAQFMADNCRQSCTTCDESVTRNRTSDERRHRRRTGSCYDEADECGVLAQRGACHNGSDTPLRCPWSCDVCRFRKLAEEAYGCADTNENCADWARHGECERNPDFMMGACTRSCEGGCARKRALCARPPGAVAAADPGGIGAAMRRILRDFPEYSPRPISQPTEEEPNAPWVMTFRDFLSDDEVDAFISGCKTHFERSLAGDQLSPVRTSQQCWCSNNECSANPLAQAVAERVRNVTNIP